MLAPSPGRPRSAAADQAILDATLTLLRQEGFAGTSMAEIARTAGVSTATLYRRYDSLAGVVIDALTRMKDPGRPRLTGSLAHDLRAYLAHLCKRLSNPDSNRLLTTLLGEAARDHALAMALYESISAPSRRNMSKMFKQAINAGEIRHDVDLELVIDLAVGPIYLRVLERVRPIEADLPDRLSDLVLNALCADPRMRFARASPNEMEPE